MSDCQIKGDADIAGIGVRVAIYMQASVAIINSALYQGHPRHSETMSNNSSQAVEDGNTPIETAPLNDENNAQNQRDPEYGNQPVEMQTPEERTPLVPQPEQPDESRVNSPSRRASTRTDSSESIHGFGHYRPLLNPKHAEAADRALERSLFITGWAIAISALSMASSRGPDGGLSKYHALVVLNLSSVNYWAGFDLLRRRTHKIYGMDKKRLWYQRLMIPFEICERPLTAIITWLPFYVHAAMFSALGIIFWLDRDTFRNGSENAACSPPIIFYWVMLRVPISNQALKTVSLIFYSCLAIPLLNGIFTELLLKASAMTLSLIITVLTSPLLLAAEIAWVLLSQMGSLMSSILLTSSGSSYAPEPHRFIDVALASASKFNRRYTELHDRVTTFVFTGPIAYWAIATEFFIRSNAKYVESGVEERWTYGQIMAFLAACLAVATYVVQIAEGISRLKLKHTLSPSSTGGQ